MATEKKLAAYDDIDDQLMNDHEKELEYLNDLDKPIIKDELPNLCPDEESHGMQDNKAMNLR